MYAGSMVVPWLLQILVCLDGALSSFLLLRFSFSSANSQRNSPVPT